MLDSFIYFKSFSGKTLRAGAALQVSDLKEKKNIFSLIFFLFHCPFPFPLSFSFFIFAPIPAFH